MDTYLTANQALWNTWTPFHLTTQGIAYYWIHSLADILGALLRMGLRIESFAEYPFMRWAFFPWMEHRDDGGWQLPPSKGNIPLMFSLKATKVA